MKITINVSIVNAIETSNEDLLNFLWVVKLFKLEFITGESKNFLVE